MNEYPFFQQDYYSRTASGINRIGHDFNRLLKLVVYYDHFYENTNYSYFMASVLTWLNEIS